MGLRLPLCAAATLVLTMLGGAGGQELKNRSSQPVTPPGAPPESVIPIAVPLIVPASTPIKVTVDNRLHVEKVGQPVHGKVAEPVYAFDMLVIPAGSEVLGRISAIDPVPGKQRTLSAMDANFTPPHQVHVDFNELILPGGRHVPIQTAVTPAPGGVLQLVSAHSEKDQPAGSTANTKGNPVKREVIDISTDTKEKWGLLKRHLKSPGGSLKQMAVAESPYHRQYLNPGTAFDAALLQPMYFGVEELSVAKLTNIGTEPPPKSMVHARLTTPLTSAKAKPGDPVEAIITQPLVVSGNLFLPEGSRLKGRVLQAKPAHRLGHNGQLRIAFHQVVPPGGVERTVEASLEAVTVAKDDHLKLDAEGGAQETSPKSRYVTTGISVALAASATFDQDAGHRTPGADTGSVPQGAATGMSGFRLVGSVLGATVHTRAVSAGLGLYGAAFSSYSQFLARGHDVVYPKDMPMLVELGTRGADKAGNTVAARK